MVKAGELRVGNWVKVGDMESTVCLIDHNSCIQLLGNAIVNRSEQIDPIPLSAEILENCGFEKRTVTVKDRYGGYTSIHFDIELTNGKDFCLLAQNVDDVQFFIFDNPVIVYVKYLHQLQNLYFALTGEELNIKNLIK